MNYKHLFLSALLLPLTITSYGKSVETRIKELKAVQLQKELELSDLGEMIDKKYEHSDHYTSSGLSCWKASRERKISNLQKKDALSKEEYTKATSEIESSYDQFIKNLREAFDTTRDINQIIENELLDQDGFDHFRIIVLRIILEQRLVKKLIGKYEACIQELVKIDQELANLEK